ncbi:MAG: class I SAM-dependent methyltransferase [SAR324 cluster bacterium]|nr:class I SAM-dependent methyltransferase [SAR324 cluster bacterium]MDP6463890.1 class I SAM-dependent methyltransferase [SAR324 cluster bacterium]
MTFSLKEHLKRYGIYEINKDKYWTWSGKKLGERKIKRLNILREPIVKGCATEEDYLRFVEYIASPKVASVVHTMNYGGIYKCCEYINNYIEGATSILDIGCNIGYGTTWFSLNHKKSHFTGCDVSSSSIKTAKMFSNKFKINNIQFINENVTDLYLNKKFDLVISSQCLKYVEDGNNGLNSIKRFMNEDSNLICIEHLNSKSQAKEFISNIKKNNLYLNYFNFPIIYNSFDGIELYPVMFISKSNKNYIFDLDDIFEKKLNLLEKFNYENQMPNS